MIQSYFVCIIFLYSFIFSFSVHCSDKHYEWNIGNKKLVCDMCPPGQYMQERCSEQKETVCKPCPTGQYLDSYNVARSCPMCLNCNMSFLEFESQCQASHNSVCRCKSGYRCAAQSCNSCVKEPSTTTASPTPASTNKALRDDISLFSYVTKPVGASTLKVEMKSKTDDFKWSVAVIVNLLCMGVLLIVTTVLRPVLRRIRANDKPKPATERDIEEKMGEMINLPVQEVCGKCDQHVI